MKKSSDLINKTFGKLKVVGRLESTKQGSIWLCLCECGNSTKASTGALNKKQRVSCGCIHIGKNSSRFKGYKDIGGSYWSQIQAAAKRRGLEFSITIQEAWDLFEKQDKKCSLSGINIALNSSETHRHGIQTASLDRIDNNKGYVVGNIVFCRKRINTSKHQFSLKEMSLYMPFWYDKIVKAEWISKEN